jgi:hypothetical protein
MKLCLTNFGRYLPVFLPVFLVFTKTGFSVACQYFFPNDKKIPGVDTGSTYIARPMKEFVGRISSTIGRNEDYSAPNASPNSITARLV